MSDALPHAWSPPGRLGAHVRGRECTFRVWAPSAASVELRLIDADRTIAMNAEDGGYFTATVSDVEPGARYKYALSGGEYPDPASRHQPDGVHGASAVVPETFAWTDAGWRAPAQRDLIIYELHVGTFTEQGTFESAIAQLPRLRELGVNAVELMPIAQFPGTRNWGYDGVYPFAAQNSYGGPLALKRFVDAAHRNGIAVLLDVVYNHVGPEGNYLPVFGPYFTDRYHTPWGDALNFDGAGSDEVRAFFIQSALQWIDEFHMDGLRCDAVHAIVDASARPFLAELTDRVRERASSLNRTVFLIAESDLSDPRMIAPTTAAGFGYDAQWLDDFHHAIHTVLTGEANGYYEDYGSIDHIARCLKQAYVYAGDYSGHRGRRHGAPLQAVQPQQFIVCVQNHDQIGNRLAGDRLTTALSPAQLRLAAALTLLGPFIPMLFMGEEYGETSPFPYFVSHGDPQLVEAVRTGRKAEFASFGWAQEPPDPQSESTFRSAIIEPAKADAGLYRALLILHRDLIALRVALPLLHDYDALEAQVLEQRVLRVTRRGAAGELTLLANFSEHPVAVAVDAPNRLAIATDDPRYDPDCMDTFDAAESVDIRLNDPTTVDGRVDVQPFSALLLQSVSAHKARPRNARSRSSRSRTGAGS